MSRNFKIVKDYYEEEVYLYKKATVEFKPGMTVLVGCNGAGKTTLLHQIENRLKKEHIPCLYYNCDKDGKNEVSKAAFYSNFEFIATAISSSEGENLVLNMGNTAQRIGKLVRENPTSSEIWILLDAVDSGLSIDNVVGMKENLFNLVFETTEGKDIYIVVSANAYEMCRGENCFDVINGKYLKFKDYEDYRDFVLKSAQEKEKRYEGQ